MRHGKKINHLSRKYGHRQAMLSNMAASLILSKRITTTVAKAKALKVYAEPLINRAKEDTTHSRRMVFRYLGNKEAVTELFQEVGNKVADRPGGYTRILRTGKRLGDNAEMCILELVDYNTTYTGGKEEKAEGKRRRRRTRRGGAASAETKAQESPAEGGEVDTGENQEATSKEENITEASKPTEPENKSEEKKEDKENQ